MENGSRIVYLNEGREFCDAYPIWRRLEHLVHCEKRYKILIVR